MRNLVALATSSKKLVFLFYGVLSACSLIIANQTVKLHDAELYSKAHVLAIDGAFKIKVLIDQQLLINIGTIDALSGIIETNKDITQQDFSSLIGRILPKKHSLLEVQITTGTVISHISHLPDRFHSLGLDLSTIPHQRNILLETLKDRRLRIAGPFPMVGADKNIVVARDPIFIDDTFFGFSMYLIDFDQMMKSIAYNGEFAIRGLDERTDSHAFYGDDTLFQREHSVLVDVPLRDGGWQVVVTFGLPQSSLYFVISIYGICFLFVTAIVILCNLTIQLKLLTNRDPLTGVYNRRYLDGVYQKQKMSFALYLDLDYFKKINDIYGHAVGDRVLIKFALLLRNTTRSIDIIARMGGEEFLVLLDSSNAEAALKIAERICAETSVLCFREDHKLRITTSGGLTKIRSGENLHSLLKRADILLYQAKEKGRNTIEIEGVVAQSISREYSSLA